MTTLFGPPPPIGSAPYAVIDATNTMHRARMRDYEDDKYAEFIQGREAEQVLKITPFPAHTARDTVLSIRSAEPREAGLVAGRLVNLISDHYHKQLTLLQKELALVHQMYPEKVVLELEAIKTELADLRRHLCDRDTK